MLADYGFGDRARLNFACAIAVPIAAGALLFIFGRRAYLATIDRLDTAEGIGSALASGLPRNVA